MESLDPSMAQQIAQAAIAFQNQRTGMPKSVAVVLSGDTLLITLHGALSPAEKALAQSPEGAAQVQEFHRQLFTNAADHLRREIKRITGVEARRSDHGNRNVDGHRGAGLHDGPMVQVFLWPKACLPAVGAETDRVLAERHVPGRRRGVNRRAACLWKARCGLVRQQPRAEGSIQLRGDLS